MVPRMVVTRTCFKNLRSLYKGKTFLLAPPAKTRASSPSVSPRQGEGCTPLLKNSSIKVKCGKTINPLTPVEGPASGQCIEMGENQSPASASWDLKVTVRR